MFLVEHAPENKRGLWGSLSLFGSGIGFLLASAIGALTMWLAAGTTYAEMAWRFPFLLGSLLGVIGFYLRMKMPEPAAFAKFLESDEEPHKFPLLYAFRQNKLAMLKAVFLVFSPLMASYLLFVYLPSYLVLYLKLPLDTVLLTNAIGWFFVILLYPIAGILSDHFGRKLILALGTTAMCVLIYPLFLILQHATFTAIVSVQIIFACLLAGYYAAIPTTLAEMFEMKIRYSAVAFPQNIAAVLGGTAPIVVTFLIHYTGNIAAPSFYLIFSGLLMLLAIFSLQENHKTLILTEG